MVKKSTHYAANRRSYSRGTCWYPLIQSLLLSHPSQSHMKIFVSHHSTRLSCSDLYPMSNRIETPGLNRCPTEPSAGGTSFESSQAASQTWVRKRTCRMESRIKRSSNTAVWHSSSVCTTQCHRIERILTAWGHTILLCCRSGRWDWTLGKWSRRAGSGSSLPECFCWRISSFLWTTHFFSFLCEFPRCRGTSTPNRSLWDRSCG